jgi:hypothetical protein
MSVSMARMHAIMDGYFVVENDTVTFNYPDARVAHVAFDKVEGEEFHKQLKKFYPSVYNLAIDLIFDMIHPY